MMPGATVEVTILAFIKFSKTNRKRAQPPRVSERSPRDAPTQPASQLPGSKWSSTHPENYPTDPARQEQRNPSENSSTHPTIRNRYTAQGSSTHPENYPARHPPSNHQDKKNETHPGTVHPTQRPKADTIPTCSSIHHGNYPATDPLRDHRRPWQA